MVSGGCGAACSSWRRSASARVGADLLAVGADEAADIDGGRQQVLTVRLERFHETRHDPATGRDGLHGEARLLPATTQIALPGLSLSLMGWIRLVV